MLPCQLQIYVIPDNLLVNGKPTKDARKYIYRIFMYFFKFFVFTSFGLKIILLISHINYELHFNVDLWSYQMAICWYGIMAV